MSKRVANTRERTARNGRVRFGWRTIMARQVTRGPKLAVDPVMRTARVARPRPKKTVWTKFKDIFRRTQSR